MKAIQVFNAAMMYDIVCPGSCLARRWFVFLKVRAATGGRLRIALSGGATISRDTQEFLTTALVTE